MISTQNSWWIIRYLFHITLPNFAALSFVDCVNFLLQCGCPATVKNTNGATPLHYSVAEGCFRITKALLESSASPNALVTTNEVFIFIAVTSSSTIINWLLN